jgi:hypothetical protein
MNDFNIEWRESNECGHRSGLYANVLGYYLLLEPVCKPGFSKPVGYTVTYTEAGNPNDAWTIESSSEHPFEMPSPSEEAAKQAATVWLASQVRKAQTQPAPARPEVSMAEVFEMSRGMRYALKFMTALRPLLSSNDNVRVAPAVGEDDHTGLAFANHETGYGVRILSCSRAEHVAMTTGTIAELESNDQENMGATYFHESEIPGFAQVAAKMYLGTA